MRSSLFIDVFILIVIASVDTTGDGSLEELTLEQIIVLLDRLPLDQVIILKSHVDLMVSSGLNSTATLLEDELLFISDLYSDD